MTFAVIKKQLTELIDDRKSFVSKDAEHNEIYLKDIEALENAINILDYHKSLKKSFENLAQQLADEQQTTVTECCPHCDTVVNVDDKAMKEWRVSDGKKLKAAVFANCQAV